MAINIFSFAGVTNTALDVTIIVLFMLFSVIVVLATVYLLSKFLYKPKLVSVVNGSSNDNTTNDKKAKSFNITGMLFAILGLGLIVRIIFVFAIKGDRTSFNEITALITHVSSNGLGGYYSETSYRLYPLVAYLYSFIGIFTKAFSVTSSSEVMPFFVKLPFVISDLALAGVLYFAAKRYINELTGLVIAGFVCLFPVFIFASSVWGSYYSIAALLFALSFYFVSTKNYLGLTIAYSLALLTVKEAIFLYPIIAIFVIYSYVKLCMHYYSEKSNESILASSEYRNIVLIPVYIVLSTVIMYLVTLPFIIDINAGFFAWIGMQYFKPIAAFTTFGTNGLNIFNLFLRNGVELSVNFPFTVFAVLFSIIVIALVALIYLSRKNRANLSFLAAYILMTLSIFFMGFGAMNIFVVFGILVLSFILIKDRRILHVLSLSSLSAMLNAFAVMAVQGHINNLEDHVFSSASYSGVKLLESGGALAVSLVCTVVMIITFIYATIVLLDLSMSNRRVLFKNVANVGIFESLKNWFK